MSTHRSRSTSKTFVTSRVCPRRRDISAPANFTTSPWPPISQQWSLTRMKDCKDGSCDVQLPVAAIEAFRDRIDWSRSYVDAQVNRLARPMLLRLLEAYRRGGNRALGEYRD